MDLTYSVDAVARTSDDAAVRAQFDVRTLTWVRVVAIVAVLVSFPHAIAGLADGAAWQGLLGATSFILSVLFALAVRKSRRDSLGGHVRAYVRPVAIGYLLAQTTLLSLYHAATEGTVALSVIIAMLAIGYRLHAAEHVLLHATLAAIPSLVVMIFPHPREAGAAMIMPVIVANMMFMMLSLFISRRARRSIVADWSERRASAREQVRMRDELAYARELQLSMLPECAPKLAWADICSISVPATEVGGDYYDYFIDENRVALVCGDVAGHGMASGLVLSALRTGFTLLHESLHEPARVLQRLHELIGQATRRRMLVTVSVVLLDLTARRAIITSAGHPPVIVRHADGSVETINLFAPPLGVRLPVTMPQRELALSAGDLFVLHSDGVYETRNAADEVYGLERLQRVVQQHGDAPAEAVRDAILSDLAAFRGGREQDDDVTVVVCRITSVS